MAIVMKTLEEDVVEEGDEDVEEDEEDAEDILMSSPILSASFSLSHPPVCRHPLSFALFLIQYSAVIVRKSDC